MPEKNEFPNFLTRMVGFISDRPREKAKRANLSVIVRPRTRPRRSGIGIAFQRDMKLRPNVNVAVKRRDLSSRVTINPPRRSALNGDGVPFSFATQITSRSE